MEGIRYANIGLAVAMPILVVGVVLFRDAGEGVVQIIGMTSFFLGLAIYHGLERRAKRRRRDQ